MPRDRLRGEDRRLTRKERVRRVRRAAPLAFAAVLLPGLAAWSADGALGAIVAIAVAASLLAALLLRELGALRIALSELRSLEALAPLREGEVYPANPAALCPENALTVCQEILLRRPRVVVELGSGSSTVLLGRCLESLGGGGRRLVSLEHDEGWYRDSQQKLLRAGLEKTVTLLHAPRRAYEGHPSTWYDLSELPEDLGPIELVLVDGPEGGSADPLARYAALPALAARLADGAVLYVDDALREGEREIVKRWSEEFPGLRVEFVSSRNGLWRVEYRKG